MQPIMQQRYAGLQALRTRTAIATAELYAMIGMEVPVQHVRFQVQPKGVSAYHIVELSTGKVKGFRFTYKAAVNFAQVLEALADGVKVTLQGAPQ